MEKIVVFADQAVGYEIVKYLLNNYFSIIENIIVADKNSEVFQYLRDVKIQPDKVLFNEQLSDDLIVQRLVKSNVDLFILAWWPFILKRDIYSIPKIGTINFHPSLLPYNRGKHYNFWTLVEETPFGVSLHFVDDTIDSGDIIAQRHISKNWEDTGKTLYIKAQKTIIDLFKDEFPNILKRNFNRTKQNFAVGTFHYGKEMFKACEIKLDEKYTARYLFNLLRAKTFPPHPGCFFFDDGKKYELTINIKEIENDGN